MFLVPCMEMWSSDGWLECEINNCPDFVLECGSVTAPETKTKTTKAASSRRTPKQNKDKDKRSRHTGNAKYIAVRFFKGPQETGQTFISRSECAYYYQNKDKQLFRP